MSTPKKVCTKCKTEKTILHFHACPNARYGVHSICKLCRNVTERKRSAVYWKTNREAEIKKKRERMRRTREAAAAGSKI